MYRGPNTVIKWQGLDADGRREIPMTPSFVSKDGVSLIAMVCRRQGLVLLSERGLKDYGSVSSACIGSLSTTPNHFNDRVPYIIGSMLV